MPHVDIKCYPGRTEEQKKLCAKKVANVISEIMGCDVSHVSIAINEVEKEDCPGCPPRARCMEGPGR